MASLSSRKWMTQGLLRTEETWPLVRRTRGLTFINMVNGERARSLDSIRSSCSEERPSRMLLLPDSILCSPYYPGHSPFDLGSSIDYALALRNACRSELGFVW